MPIFNKPEGFSAKFLAKNPLNNGPFDQVTSPGDPPTGPPPRETHIAGGGSVVEEGIPSEEPIREQPPLRQVDSNKQKLFGNKASELRRAWKSIKDPNSNRAKQLKKEAKTIGLTLEQQMPGWDK